MCLAILHEVALALDDVHDRRYVQAGIVPGTRRLLDIPNAMPAAYVPDGPA